ncbi:MAG: alpha/beta fold hydrolase [Saprospiraceae bacterium]|nr:alpha/beta fold hydrolase [Saprospiraceae bacterium]
MEVLKFIRQKQLFNGVLCLIVLASTLLYGCDEDSDQVTPSAACSEEPLVRTSSEGVDYVRTPDACFADVVFPGINYQPRYVEINGLRAHYVEAGPADGEVILMLHGQPTWSYLYRYMIDAFAEAGFRAIAYDFIGMGRSDKPVDISYYSYIGQTEELEQFIEILGLSDITLITQDWGANIGLRLVGLRPDLFSHVVAANGAMPLFPAGAVPYPPVENPDELDFEVLPYYDGWPDQQELFRDNEGNLLIDLNFNEEFPTWMRYTMKSPNFNAGVMVEANTWFPISEADEAAYNAPFPSREYMALARYWPSMALEVGGVNEGAWVGLLGFEKPFLTLYTPNDVGVIGEPETYQPYIDNVPGAEGQPHDKILEASHFVQDDQGYSLAQRVIDFIDLNR